MSTLLADEQSEREIHDRDPCPPESRCAICWPEKQCHLCPLPEHPAMNCYEAAEKRCVHEHPHVGRCKLPSGHEGEHYADSETNADQRGQLPAGTSSSVSPIPASGPAVPLGQARDMSESPLGRAVRIARGDTGPPTKPMRFAKPRSLEDAMRSSAYWKAELIAANEEIASLRAMIRVKDADYQHVRLVYENASVHLRAAIELLGLVAQELQCGDRPTGHYCPNCGNSSYNISQKVEVFLKKLI